MSWARCTLTRRGTSPFRTRASASSFRLRSGSLALSFSFSSAGGLPAASIFLVYSCALISSARRRAIALARVPGDLPSSRGPRPFAEGRRHHREGHDGVRVDVAPARLHDHGLAADERARAVAGVDRRDPEAAHPAHEAVGRVVGVDGPQLGLDRGRGLELVLVVRLVHEAREADRAARVDEAGGDDLGGEGAIAGGDGDGGRGPHGLDLPVLHQHHAVLQRGPGHGVDGLAADRDLGGGPRGSQDEERRDQSGHRPSSSSPSVWAKGDWSWLAPYPPVA